jgi:hypothetical protein
MTCPSILVITAPLGNPVAAAGLPSTTSAMHVTIWSGLEGVSEKVQIYQGSRPKRYTASTVDVEPLEIEIRPTPLAERQISRIRMLRN